jgi:hypothetical protein
VVSGSAFASNDGVRERSDDVLKRSDLLQLGRSPSEIVVQLRARRWQRRGRAIVMHNGPITRTQRWQVALLNCGPRAVLTSFTALEALGLTGWERDEVHVLAPAGVAAPLVSGLAVHLHRTADWRQVESLEVRRCHRPAGAAVLAAS